RPRPSPLFPYTTLFRSHIAVLARYLLARQADQLVQRFRAPGAPDGAALLEPSQGVGRACRPGYARVHRLPTWVERRSGIATGRRSEEHTSELQSQSNLV